MKLSSANNNNLIYKSLQLDIYTYLINNVNLILNDDESYIKKFNSYYRLRRNKNNWLKPYYNIFKEALLNKDNLKLTDFNYYLNKVNNNCIHNGRHQNEVSFTSKMLHTIRPDIFPIYDSQARLSIGLNEMDYLEYVAILDDILINDININNQINDLKKLLKPNLLNEFISNYKWLDLYLFF